MLYRGVKNSTLKPAEDVITRDRLTGLDFLAFQKLVLARLHPEHEFLARLLFELANVILLAIELIW